MKIKITLYGCANYFGKMDNAKRRICFRELGKVFGEVFVAVANPTVEVFVNYEHVVVPRTYIADVELLPAEEKNEPDSKILDDIANKFGLLWMEYVRPFIDSGGLIATRVSTKTIRAISSPHGVSP